MKIKAKENGYLTQVGEVADYERVYCTELICPDDTKQNWRNASDEEYNEWHSRMQAMENLANEDEEFY